MNSSQRRKMDKIDREEAFMLACAADFPLESRAGKLTILINVEKAKILQFDAQQTSGFDDKRQEQEIYDNRRDDLIDLLQTFILAASIVDDEIEGTAAKFKMPHPRNDRNLIAKVVSFYNDSAAIETELTEAGLEANARTNLQTINSAFQQAAIAHDGAEKNHAEASGGMIDSVRKIMEYSRSRAKSIKMKYRNNAAKLAAWTVASHLERAPKWAKDKDGGDDPST